MNENSESVLITVSETKRFHVSYTHVGGKKLKRQLKATVIQESTLQKIIKDKHWKPYA